MTHGPPERKAKWAPFSGPPRYATEQTRHTHTGVSARGLLGEGRVKTHVRVRTLERPVDRQTEQERDKEETSQEKQEAREQAVHGGHF